MEPGAFDHQMASQTELYQPRQTRPNRSSVQPGPWSGCSALSARGGLVCKSRRRVVSLNSRPRVIKKTLVWLLSISATSTWYLSKAYSFGVRVSMQDFEFRVSGICPGFRISRFGYLSRGSSVGFRVAGAGFRGWGLGSKV